MAFDFNINDVWRELGNFGRDMDNRIKGINTSPQSTGEPSLQVGGKISPFISRPTGGGVPNLNQTFNNAMGQKQSGALGGEPRTERVRESAPVDPSPGVIDSNQSATNFADLLEQAQMNLGNIKAPEYSSYLNTKPIEEANSKAVQMMKDALNSSLGAINNSRTRTKGAYGTAEGNIDRTYSTHVNDILKTNPKLIQQATDTAVNSYDDLNARLVDRLKGAISSQADERKARNANTGAPNAPSQAYDVLSETMGNITADSADRQSMAIAEGQQDKSFVGNQANALRSEQAGALGGLASELAAVLGGYDSQEADLRGSYAQQNASMANAFSGQMLDAQLAQSNAEYQAAVESSRFERDHNASLMRDIIAAQGGERAAQAEAAGAAEAAAAEAELERYKIQIEQQKNSNDTAKSINDAMADTIANDPNLSIDEKLKLLKQML